MSLVTVIGKVERADITLKTLIETGKVNPISADIGIAVIRENYKESWGVPTEFLATTLSRMAPNDPLEKMHEKLDNLFEQLQIPREIDKSHLDLNLGRSAVFEQIDAMHEAFIDLDHKMKSLTEKKAELQRFASVDKLDSVDFDLSKLKNLKHFEVRLGTMDYEYERRMEINYDNINALVLKAGTLDKQPIYMFISPVVCSKQTDNLLRSMHFEPLDIIWEYMDFPNVMKQKLQADITKIQAQLDALDSDLDTFRKAHYNQLINCYTHLKLEARFDELRPLVYDDDEHYLAAFWVPVELTNSIKNQLHIVDDHLHFIVHDDDAAKGVIVPTKLLNSWLFRPFETLVNLYGTPNYREVDPTGFLALAYMFLFGAMFGDLGQGFIFWLAGLFIGKKGALKSVGGVLKRIGASSMVFGVIYDSVFGIEHLISGIFEKMGIRGIFLRPIENTNLILMLSVIAGIVLLTISFGFSIYNKLKNGDIQEGVFGKNGINGFVLFAGFVTLAGLIYFDVSTWIIRLVVALIGLSVLLLIIREPLSNALAKKMPLYHEGAGAYYMESGFELLETFLGMLSNGISFIRVGAFALNHVGLFIAFHTIANMIGNHMGDILMFIIGNVVVIALEGLIVFIQGLRLVYYELFSKYYQGDGQPFVGIDIGVDFSKANK